MDAAIWDCVENGSSVAVRAARATNRDNTWSSNLTKRWRDEHRSTPPPTRPRPLTNTRPATAHRTRDLTPGPRS